MTATHGLGTYGNAAGTVTPLDHKMANLGLIVKTAANTVRAGVFWDGNSTIVSGKANMSYDVRALAAVLSRGATAGAVLLTNDAVYNVATTAAPGSNSRYDVVYLWQREYSIDGTDSNPVIGVVQGTAAASPSVPSLSAFPGAISLAQILVPAGVTATNSGTTITQTAPFTTVSGGVVAARTTTERDLYVPASTDLTARCWVIADGVTYKWNGTAWKAWESDWITYTPTLGAAVGTFAIGTGGSAKATLKYQYEDGLVHVKDALILGTTGTMGTTITITLPVNSTVPVTPYRILTQLVTITDSSAIAGSTVPFFGAVVANNVSQSSVIIRASSGTANITPSVPMTWAAGDSIEVDFFFEPA